jgi:hypothetical protein
MDFGMYSIYHFTDFVENGHGRYIPKNIGFLSWNLWIQLSITPSYISKIHSNIILPASWFSYYVKVLNGTLCVSYRVIPILSKMNKVERRRDGVVGIATSCVLDDWRVGVRVPVRSRIFSTSSRPALGSTQPPILRVPRAVSSRLKRPGSEAEHSS